MKITSINRRMPLSETLQRVGTIDSKAFGRTSRTYRKGGLMFTITASQSEWNEFDSNGYLHRMEMITDHLSDEDASLLYRSEATVSRGVAAVNSFLKKLDEAQEAEEAKARKAKAEKAAAEQTAAMEAAEAARQQEIAALVVATLKQCGFDPAGQQAAAPANTVADTTTPASTPQAPAATTTAAPTADQQQSATAITQQEINVMVAEALKQCGFQPTTATVPATPTAPQAPATTQATPPAADTTAPPADDKSKKKNK